MSRMAASIKLDAELAAEAREAAAAEGVRLDDFVQSVIKRAAAEVRGRRYWQARAAGADITRARAILNRAGGQPPAPGDEILED